MKAILVGSFITVSAFMGSGFVRADTIDYKAALEAAKEYCQITTGFSYGYQYQDCIKDVFNKMISSPK